MKESEIFVCKRCGKEHEAITQEIASYGCTSLSAKPLDSVAERTRHEALTQEIASYSCPNLSKTKTKLKVLDSVSLNLLTELINSSETRDLKTNSVSQNGASKYVTSK